MSEAKQTPAIDLLATIPRETRLLIDEAYSTRSVPIGALAAVAVEQIRTLTARAEAAEADARRYRWLRNSDNYPDPDWWNNVLSQTTWGYDFDNAIDAELAKEPKP